MSSFEAVKKELVATPKTWLITGVAGFIGSNLLEELLNLGQTVTGIDNFSTGHQANLDEVQSKVGDNWKKFHFFKKDICNLEHCKEACENVDYILHQAALGSVPRSIDDPIKTNESNVSGFLNMLIAARDSKVKRFVYAASSSTYGDHPGLPKVENQIGSPLSPYAVTKYVNELYADVFAKTYKMETIGLRYFNVFGPRQDPNGAYAAVIPCWFGNLMSMQTCQINGDGETSRDFCFISNTVQANLLAATTSNPQAINQIYNVACGNKTSLNELFEIIKALLSAHHNQIKALTPFYNDFRPGDVRHSLADITKARELLGYEPAYNIQQGLAITSDWFLTTLNSKKPFTPTK